MLSKPSKMRAGPCIATPSVFNGYGDSGGLGQNTGIFPGEENPLRCSSLTLLPFFWILIILRAGTMPARSSHGFCPNPPEPPLILTDGVSVASPAKF